MQTNHYSSSAKILCILTGSAEQNQKKQDGHEVLNHSPEKQAIGQMHCQNKRDSLKLSEYESKGQRMILVSIAKQKCTFTHLFNCIVNFAQNSSTSSMNSCNINAKKANLTLPQKCQGQLRSSLKILGQKSLKLSTKSYKLAFSCV